MNATDKHIQIMKCTKFYFLSKSLYVSTGFLINGGRTLEEVNIAPIVGFHDNFPLKCRPTQNLQELFNLEYGLENLKIKIEYNRPYVIKQ